MVEVIGIENIVQFDLEHRQQFLPTKMISVNINNSFMPSDIIFFSSQYNVIFNLLGFHTQLAQEENRFNCLPTI